MFPVHAIYGCGRPHFDATLCDEYAFVYVQQFPFFSIAGGRLLYYVLNTKMAYLGMVVVTARPGDGGWKRRQLWVSY